MARVEAEVGADRFRRVRYAEAGGIFGQQCMAPELDDFLTLDAYIVSRISGPVLDLPNNFCSLSYPESSLTILIPSG